ncbi:MAG: 4'-phosphopantetheinyl transferase superfamily protein [Oscillospiraceae bacterium]|nr:4'-phosphopantetheinyl transferase superfamily protein [Oscillospiraceae bacterium]
MDITVYYTDIDTSLGIDHYIQLSALVSDERRERVRRMIPEKGKIMCLMSEVVMRSHLSRLTGVPVKDIILGKGEHGKPCMTGANIPFSLSHSENRIIFAHARTPIGIDIELRESGRSGIAERFFTPNEYERIISSSDADSTFYDIWTAKEAYIKMTGEGLSRSLSSFDVISQMQGMIATVHTDGYTVSVCCEGIDRIITENYPLTPAVLDKLLGL